MSERDENSAEEPIYRCPTCDSVVSADTQRCLMCGTVQPERPLSIPQPPVEPEPEPEIVEAPPEEEPEPESAPEALVELASEAPEETIEDQPAQGAASVFVHVEDPYYAEASAPSVGKPIGLQKPLPDKPHQKNRSLFVYGITAVAIMLIILFVSLGLKKPDVVTDPLPAELVVTSTLTFTPSPTLMPTGTEPPPAAPTITLTPLPTDTPEPPRQHTISIGDTLFGLALQYRITLGSILETNEMTESSSIIAGQTLLIPWPTATPPLEPVGIEYNGELVIADPTDCRRYEVVSGDSLNAIAARADIDYDLFLLVNRLTSESVIQPGDTVCLPDIVYGATLQPTAGPSPTPSMTPLPPGPSLLYPVPETVIEPPDGLVTLQWVAIKDLAEDEWYMVEVTDMDRVNSVPWRGFTRDNAFQLPSSWRPDVVESHHMRWRVSLVKVTGFREDGLPIFTYGGQSSDDALFSWEGAIPTPTPVPTATKTAVPTLVSTVETQ